MSKILPVITVLLTILSIVIILFIGNIVIRDRNSGWNCTEKGCNYDIDGEYTTKSHCMKECKLETDDDVSDDVTDDVTDDGSDDNEEFNKWSCTSNYQCVKSNQGWDSQIECKNNCLPTYNYVPQTLYYQRRPLYQGPRWFSPRRRRFSPRRRRFSPRRRRFSP
jgi:hypothetical protein